MKRGRTKWTEDEAQAFGRRVRELREDRSLSQREMCAGTTVTAAYLSRIEKGDRYPSVVVIREFAEKLGVSAEFLEFGTGPASVVCARATVADIDEAAERFGVALRWDDLASDEQRAVTVGLDEALTDTLAARLYAVAVNRGMAVTRVRALTLTQPWGSLVAGGAKRWETRSWATTYRGPLAVHAAKGFPPAARALCAVEPFRRCLLAITLCEARDLDRWPENVLPLGALLGITWLEDVVPTEAIRDELDEEEVAFGDYAGGRWAWKLREPLDFAPIPAKGALGLWRVPDDLIPEPYRLAIRHPGAG